MRRAMKRGLTVLLAASAILVATDAWAVIGRPFTPMSYAGVARRTTRRVAYAGAAATHGAYYGGAYANPWHYGAGIGWGLGVVAAVPGGCGPILAAGYYHCGGYYYTPYYEGAEVVYVKDESPPEKNPEGEEEEK